MSVTIYVRLGGSDLLQGVYQPIQSLDEYIALLEPRPGEEKEVVPEFGLINDKGKSVFIYPFSYMYHDKKIIHEIIGSMNNFCKAYNRPKISKIELSDNNTGIERIIRLKHLDNGYTKWNLREKRDNDIKNNDGEVCIIEYGLCHALDGREIFDFALKDRDDDECSLGPGITLEFFNSVCEFIGYGNIKRLETINGHNEKQKTRIKSVGNFDFWVTYKGDDSHVDSLCDMIEEVIQCDYYKALRKFERNCDVVLLRDLEEDLNYIFSGRLDYENHLEPPLFNDYLEVEALIH